MDCGALGRDDSTVRWLSHLKDPLRCHAAASRRPGGFAQRSAAASSEVLASTQLAPVARSTCFQNGAAVAMNHGDAEERPAPLGGLDMARNLGLGHPGIMFERQGGDRLAVLV